VHVRAGDERVAVTCGREVVASHERVLATHVTATDPAHDRARVAARALASAPTPRADEVEVRDLSVYDRPRVRHGRSP
jgi:hypothetical protein